MMGPTGDAWMGTHMGSHHGWAGTGSMMGGAGGWGAAGGAVWEQGLLWPLLLVGLTIVVGYLLLTRTAGPDRDRALEVLRQRYASGELADEEFASRRDGLQQ